MFAVLWHYGIPEAVVNAISVLYKNSKSAVMVDGNLSDPLDVTTGVLQGDVLAPFLFVVLVDYLLKKAMSQLDSGVVTHPRHSRRHLAKSLNDLDFADIALLESSISQAQAKPSTDPGGRPGRLGGPPSPKKKRGGKGKERIVKGKEKERHKETKSS